MTAYEIKKTIADKGIESVSFDIFDTLLVRPFYTPADLFELLDAQVAELLGTIDRIDFRKHRMEAEHIARRRFAGEGREDVTLDEIYQVLGELLDFPRETSELIKSWEIEQELRFCRPRKFARELFDLAVSSGKRVVIASDMYLPFEVVEKLLEQNGYEGYEKLFLSSVLGCTKATGRMYDYMARDLGVEPKAILHIGDNETADVRRAKEKGFKTIYLPKCTDMLMNAVSGSYGGEIFQKAYGESFLHRFHVTKDFLGIRTMLAVAAQKIFDNPFRPIGEKSDLNGEPALLGYGVLGPHLFAVADWLHREMKREGFDRLCFMARDGYLPLQAYEVLKKVNTLASQAEYVHFTRSSILPLRIKQEADWWALSRGVVPTAKSPKNIVDWFEDFLTEEERAEAPRLCEAEGFDYEQKFASLEEWDAFIRFFKKKFYHPDKFELYRQKMKEALKPMLGGRTATFDIGYHYRVDDALKQLGFDITPYCLHIMDDMASCRAERNGFGGHTFYGYNPGISGMIREVLISELAPTCKKLLLLDGSITPVYADDKEQPGDEKIRAIQENALAFVQDLVEIFGDDLKHLHYQKEDASLALEYFLTHPKTAELDIFAEMEFEEDFGQSKNFRLKEFWLWQIGQMERGSAHGASEDPRFRFPEEEIPEGTRLIIYGGGVVGKTYLSQARRNTEVEIVALCDREPELTGINEVPVVTPAQLVGMDDSDYDMVLIAIEREQIADSIRRELQIMGVPGEKMGWISPTRRVVGEDISF